MGTLQKCQGHGRQGNNEELSQAGGDEGDMKSTHRAGPWTDLNKACMSAKKSQRGKGLTKGLIEGCMEERRPVPGIVLTNWGQERCMKGLKSKLRFCPSF